jgi:hypothetical protein
MPAFDAIHEPVKRALGKDGWSITDDPFTIVFEDLTLFADLGAERPFSAVQGERKVVIEAKSFRGPSPIHDFKLALGQYLLYRALLEVESPERELYLAVGGETYETVIKQAAIQVVIQRYQIALLVVDVEKEEVLQWIR